MLECRAACMLPHVQDCNVEALKAQAISLNPYAFIGDSAGIGAVSACEEKHNQYQAQLSAYKTCLAGQSSYTPPATSCPANSTAVGSQCYCNSGYKVQGSICVLSKICPVNSTNINGACTCDSGYILANGSCKTSTIACAETTGTYSHVSQTTTGFTTTSVCICNDGFAAGADGVCVDKRPTRTISKQAYDWARNNKSCRVNPAFSAQDMSDCIVYHANSTPINWQVTSPPQLPVTAANNNASPSVDVHSKNPVTPAKEIKKTFLKSAVVSPVATSTVSTSSTTPISLASSTPPRTRSTWTGWVGGVFEWFVSLNPFHKK